jgi:hypothetical protein
MKDIEIVVFNDKSWVRLTEYQKVKEENEKLNQDIIEIEKVSDYRWEENEKLKAQIEEMEKEKCELLGIIQKKDNFIEKLKCCAKCKYGKQGNQDRNGECHFCDVEVCICDVTNDTMAWDEKCDNWELAE